eukprot:TRINITY_DN25430_c0_g1_i1.p1 TRINITY_DN25430_c0_g1~~TRINITY_DN25430_c0_g1_i1.p1  ORF type:complete len:425 (+),score=-79.75 TRINITY_DN25430_c0_g1_i1:796-2070(+)
MLDLKYLRQNLELVVENLARRGVFLDKPEFLALEAETRSKLQQIELLRSQRNALSKEIGKKNISEEATAVLKKKVVAINTEIQACNQELPVLQARFQDWQLQLPNLLDDTVPAGESDADNQLVRTWKMPPVFEFPAKTHVELGITQLRQMDFEAAAQLSGSRFVVLKSNIARLHRALAQFMLDFHIEKHNYTECYVPYLVKSAALIGTGQLPKFAGEQFFVQGDWDLSLIPTAEVPLLNLVSNSILSASELPLKYVSHTPCFRSEAGSYGKDVRGMIRQHQFEKVELVQMVMPENADAAHEQMLAEVEALLQQLELPYRVMLLCAKDTGFSAKKTYDVEVWLPGEQCYREISSVSQCGDFQARRMQTRFYDKDKKTRFIHTLNGSGVAVGRALVAVLENFQEADGRVRIPKVLQPYMAGMEYLS